MQRSYTVISDRSFYLCFVGFEPWGVWEQGRSQGVKSWTSHGLEEKKKGNRAYQLFSTKLLQ